MYDEDTLYVYSYSDFDEDYVFMETKYELSDVKRLEQENKQLKEQLQQKEDIINKAIKLIHNHIKEIEELKLRIYPKEYYELLEILDNKGDRK